MLLLQSSRNETVSKTHEEVEGPAILAKWLLPMDVWLVGVSHETFVPPALHPLIWLGERAKPTGESTRVFFPLLLAWILTSLLSAEEPGCPSSTNEAAFLLGVSSTLHPL